MLSRRGAQRAAIEDVPWRFAPGKGKDRYHPKDNPSGCINFATSENVLIHPEMLQYIQAKIKIPDEELLTYRYSTNGGKRFRSAMATHMTRHFNPVHPVDPSELIIASSLTAIHEMMGFCLGDHGDAILAIPPIYGRFELDFGNTDGLKMVYADLDDADPMYDSEAIISSLRAAVTKASTQNVVVRALIVVTPNNPLGRCYPASTLRALMRFCQEAGLHFISDEVYALSVFENERDEDYTPFTSAMSIDTTDLIDSSQVHVLYGMSKDFGAAGLRLGTLYTRNPLLHKTMSAIIRFSPPSGPSLSIASTILEDHQFVNQLMELSRERLLDTRRFVLQHLKAAGIQWHRGGHGGFFVFIDLSPWLPESENDPEFALADRLLQAGVGLHPREEHFGKPGWFRLVYSAMDREALSEGLHRLTKVLGEKHGARHGDIRSKNMVDRTSNHIV